MSWVPLALTPRRKRTLSHAPEPPGSHTHAQPRKGRIAVRAWIARRKADAKANKAAFGKDRWIKRTVAEAAAAAADMGPLPPHPQQHALTVLTEHSDYADACRG